MPDSFLMRKQEDSCHEHGNSCTYKRKDAIHGLKAMLADCRLKRPSERAKCVSKL